MRRHKGCGTRRADTDQPAPEMSMRGCGPQRRYQLYGLRLKSPWRLPCAGESGSELADVELFEVPSSFLRAAREATRPGSPDDWFRHVRLADGSDYVWWSGLFEFLVAPDGRRIACRALNGVSRDAFHTYLIGQVLSFALVKQGIEPLHATVVVVNEQAVAFLGDCGYGKSSLAAAFLQAGHPLLTDDLLVVKEEGHRFHAYPGPPRIKLFPEIANSLLGEGIKGTPMNNLTPKLVIPLDDHWSHRGAAPLKALYVLAPAGPASRCERVTIRLLSQRRAFLELLKNSFNCIVIEPERLKRQFLLATRLASEIPIKLLSYPRTLILLPLVREAILSDLTRE